MSLQELQAEKKELKKLLDQYTQKIAYSRDEDALLCK